MRNGLLALTVLTAAACAHRPLAGSDLDRVRRPAFISRIDDGAGPRARVFREDGAYRGKLKTLDDKEADRRLQRKLKQGLTRFELSDRLRATVKALLPREAPWTRTVDPAQVATVLQSFLVEEVPAQPPDYELLRRFGADAVVEFVIEEYGMRSQGGRAGPYLKGYARMFFIGQGDLYYRTFHADAVDQQEEHLDPFQVGKEPARYGERMRLLIDAVSAQLAQDLDPPDRRGGKPLREGSDELSAPPDDTNRTGKPPPPPSEDELPPGELPPPDA